MEKFLKSMDKIRNPLAEAFDLRFIIQLVSIAIVFGIAWGSIKTDLIHITDEIQSIKQDRVKVWAEQKVVNGQNDKDIEECRNNHFELMKKLDILIVELQNGKYCQTKK